MLDTVDLTVGQWALCIVVAASIVVVNEVKKALNIRTGEESDVGPGAVPAVTSGPLAGPQGA